MVIAVPQSNQRGIETVDGDSYTGSRPCLNRTSVGLKQCWSANDNPSPGSLNRTSVGLKLLVSDSYPSHRDSPQSNQRGIETRNGADGVGNVIHRASIEPAWD